MNFYLHPKIDSHIEIKMVGFFSLLPCQFKQSAIKDWQEVYEPYEKDDPINHRRWYRQTPTHIEAKSKIVKIEFCWLIWRFLLHLKCRIKTVTKPIPTHKL